MKTALKGFAKPEATKAIINEIKGLL